jgi:hypothetical protein
MRVDGDGEPTGHVCSAWYGDADKPMDGEWVLVKTVAVPPQQPKS